MARVDADLELVSVVDDPASEADESEADGLDAAVGPAGAEGVPFLTEVSLGRKPRHVGPDLGHDRRRDVGAAPGTVTMRSAAVRKGSRAASTCCSMLAIARLVASIWSR